MVREGNRNNAMQRAGRRKGQGGSRRHKAQEKRSTNGNVPASSLNSTVAKRSSRSHGAIDARRQQLIDHQDCHVQALTEAILHDLFPAAVRAVATSKGINTCQSLTPSRAMAQSLSAQDCVSIAVVLISAAMLLDGPLAFIDFLLCIPWRDMPQVLAFYQGTNPTEEVLSSFGKRIGPCTRKEKHHLVASSLDAPVLLDALMNFLFDDARARYLPPLLTSGLHHFVHGNGYEACDAQRAVASVLDGATPLHCAALAGNDRHMRRLLDAGANPLVRNRSGETPLELVPHCYSGDKASEDGYGCVCRPRDRLEGSECRSRQARFLIARACVTTWQGSMWRWIQTVLLCVLCLLGFWSGNATLKSSFIKAHADVLWEERRQRALARALDAHTKVKEALQHGMDLLKKCMDEDDHPSHAHAHDRQGFKDERSDRSSAENGAMDDGEEEDRMRYQSWMEDYLRKYYATPSDWISCDSSIQVPDGAEGMRTTSRAAADETTKGKFTDGLGTTGRKEGSIHPDIHPHISALQQSYWKMDDAVRLVRYVYEQDSTSSIGPEGIVPEALYLKADDWRTVRIPIDRLCETYVVWAAIACLLYEVLDTIETKDMATCAVTEAATKLRSVYDRIVVQSSSDGSITSARGLGAIDRGDRQNKSIVLVYLATAILLKAKLLLRTDVERPITRAAIVRVRQCVREWRAVCSSVHEIERNDGTLLSVFGKAHEGIGNVELVCEETKDRLRCCLQGFDECFQTWSVESPLDDVENPEAGLSHAEERQRVVSMTMRCRSDTRSACAGNGVMERIESWARRGEADINILEALRGKRSEPEELITDVLKDSIGVESATGRARLIRFPSSVRDLESVMETVDKFQASASPALIEMTRRLGVSARAELEASEALDTILEEAHRDIWKDDFDVAVTHACQFQSLASKVDHVRSVKQKYVARREARAFFDTVLKEALAPAPLEILDAISKMRSNDYYTSTVASTGLAQCKEEACSNAIPSEAIHLEIDRRLGKLESAIRKSREANISVPSAKKLCKELSVQSAAIDAACRLQLALQPIRAGFGTLKSSLIDAESILASTKGSIGSFTVGSEILGEIVKRARSRMIVEKALESLSRAVQTSHGIGDLPKLESAVLNARKVGAHEVDASTYQKAANLRIRFESAVKAKYSLEKAVRAIERSCREEDVAEAERALQVADSFGTLLKTEVESAKASMTLYKAKSTSEGRLKKALSEGAGAATLSRAIKEAASVGIKVTEARRVLKTIQSLESAMTSSRNTNAIDSSACLAALEVKIQAAELAGVPASRGSVLWEAQRVLHRVLLFEVRNELDSVLKATGRAVKGPNPGICMSQRLNALQAVVDKADTILKKIEAFRSMSPSRRPRESEVDASTEWNNNNNVKLLTSRRNEGTNSIILRLKVVGEETVAAWFESEEELDDGCSEEDHAMEVLVTTSTVNERDETHSASASGSDDHHESIMMETVKKLSEIARRRLVREQRAQTRLEREKLEEARVKRQIQLRDQAMREAMEKERTEKAKTKEAEKRAALEAAKAARRERQLLIRTEQEQARRKREEAAKAHFALLQQRRRMLERRKQQQEATMQHPSSPALEASCAQAQSDVVTTVHSPSIGSSTGSRESTNVDTTIYDAIPQNVISGVGDVLNHGGYAPPRMGAFSPASESLNDGSSLTDPHSPYISSEITSTSSRDTGEEIGNLHGAVPTLALAPVFPIAEGQDFDQYSASTATAYNAMNDAFVSQFQPSHKPQSTLLDPSFLVSTQTRATRGPQASSDPIQSVQPHSFEPHTVDPWTNTLNVHAGSLAERALGSVSYMSSSGGCSMSGSPSVQEQISAGATCTLSEGVAVGRVDYGRNLKSEPLLGLEGFSSCANASSFAFGAPGSTEFTASKDSVEAWGSFVGTTRDEHACK